MGFLPGVITATPLSRECYLTDPDRPWAHRQQRTWSSLVPAFVLLLLLISVSHPSMCCYSSCLAGQNKHTNCGSLVSFSHIPPKQSSPQHTGQILLEVRGCCLFTSLSLFLRGIKILLASPVMPCHYVSLNSCHTAPTRRDHLSFYSRRDDRELCK